MPDHLSIEEIMQFCSAKRVDSTFLALAARVNSHVMQCKECRNEYQAYLDAGAVIDKISAAGYEPQITDSQINMKLAKVKEQLREAGLSISKFIPGWSGLNLKVQTLRSLECEMLNSLAELYHPPYVAIAKSIGRESSPRSLRPPVIKSTLTDGKGSRLSIGEDGTLSIFLNAGDCDTSTLAVLVPEAENGPIHFRYLEPYDSSTFTARFENIGPGEYFASLIVTSPGAS